MVEFCRGEELYPFCRVVGTENVKVCLEFLIGSLSLPVSLRVIGCGQMDIIFEEASEFLSEGRGELGTMIGDEGIM